jgi:hypothetical protein
MLRRRPVFTPQENRDRSVDFRLDRFKTHRRKGNVLRHSLAVGEANRHGEQWCQQLAGILRCHDVSGRRSLRLTHRGSAHQTSSGGLCMTCVSENTCPAADREVHRYDIR